MLRKFLINIHQYRTASYLIILFATATHSIGYPQEIDCSNFKKGTFFYTPPNGGEVWIKRTHKKQIEKYNDENQRFIFKITWDSNCEYTLVLRKTKGVDRSKKKEIIGTTLKCKVLKEELDHYLVTLTPNNVSSPQTMTIYKK